MYLVVAVLLWFFIAFIGVSYVAILIFGVSYFDWLEDALECCREKVIPFKRSLAFLAESLKVNRLLPRSGYKSCLEVGAITGVLDLPREEEIFDIVGAEVTAENRLQFNDGATEVSYKVSMPNGASVRRTKRGRISLKRHGAVYTIKRSGYKCCSMFSLVVYSLDSSLRWYLDGTEIAFPKGGNVSLVTAPVGYMIRLFGYDSENQLCDGIIVRVV
jgi:hypothetical protein